MNDLLLLDDPINVGERLTHLCETHVLPLEEWRQTLIRDGRRVPHIDPADGGTQARLLLLMETPAPGPATTRFVSRDNRTGTAANLRRFLSAAGLSRRDTIIWNTVPWIIHAANARNRTPNRSEVADGLSVLMPFIDLLPRIQVVLLAGRIAAQAERIIILNRPDLLVLRMPHPSPTHVCTSSEIGKRIAATLAQAVAFLQSH